MRLKSLLLLLCIAAMPAAAGAVVLADATAAMPFVDGQAPVRARLIVDAQTLRPGSEAQVAVVLQIAEGWHIYWRQPGDAGMATEVQFASGHATFGALGWPEPRVFDESDQVRTYGYAGQVVLAAPMAVSDSVSQSIDIQAQVQLLACKVICVPGRLALQARLPVAAQASAAEPQTQALFAAAATPQQAQKSSNDQAKPTVGQQVDLAEPALRPLPQAPPQQPSQATSWTMLLNMVLFACLGGLILNAMPCVLPVLFLKAAGLARLGHAPKQARRHALAYTFGIVATLQLLAASVIALRSLGHSVGWGFQFQQPNFLAALACALTLFACNSFGSFELMADVDPLARAHAQAHGLWQSVLEGVLAVLVATPCSAPFLATAMGFALTQSAAVCALLFLAVGLGLAAPYALLACVPAFGRRLPRPGAWMATLKALVGWALLATVAWLCGLYAGVQNDGGLYGLLALLWLTGFGAWLVGMAIVRLPQRSFSLLALLLVLLLLASSWLLPEAATPAALGTRQAQTAPSAGAYPSQPWSAQAVQDALRANRPVLVDFTADWCVTCQYNERHVLQAKSVHAALARKNVVLLVADWTRPDDAILAALTAQGRVGVPMYLLYDPRTPQTPLLLPELLRESRVLEALGAL